MLTEHGLYKVIMRSNKVIAKQFQDWVFDVLKEIRLTGKYQLEKQLELKELVTREQALIDVFVNL